MNFNWRVKVLGNTSDALLAMGFAVNTYECASGEHWVIGCSHSQLEADVKRNGLTAITQYEAIRG
jgi:hypothetical protein